MSNVDRRYNLRDVLNIAYDAMCFVAWHKEKLINECRRRGLKVSGSKKELSLRIVEFMLQPTVGLADKERHDDHA